MSAGATISTVDDSSFMLVSVSRIDRLLILDLRRQPRRHFIHGPIRSVQNKSEVTMKRWARFALIPLLGAVSISAFAAPHLSQRACHRYPFVRPAHEVTHGELMQELKDLSLVGYREHEVDNDYPSDLEAAQQRLGALYQHDCLAHQTAAAQPGVQAQVQAN